MHKSSKFNYLFNVALSAIAVILAIAPANALPEQNISTVVKWAKTRSQLPTLRYNSEAHGYEGTKGNLYFYADVTSQNGIVNKEGITVSGDKRLKFTTKNANAVKLLQNIYNSNIANDFQKSRYITKVGRDQFYRGQKFAYIAAEVQGGSSLQIIPLNKLQEFIDNAKYCQTNQCDV
ncbi:hypothetical protein GNF10_22515 [Nostoc sp. UCD121]|uniref:hypothetical protein n=1 Tax=unclassified Nostoc TaxID=2593658 RepID=UPI0016267429|nr:MULTISPECIES: hypothetical protein [unclassified Nostoc]MBC1223793.1 hypothetical protein [Nostoc sp. UCD120]MBC1278660.1 hypothetical protein [Nostoc sp. UCD121]MBC1295842.1 hypothetical protein [Nostoc sp. UCD122]